jgi:hypothetical protein
MPACTAIFPMSGSWTKAANAGRPGALPSVMDKGSASSLTLAGPGSGHPQGPGANVWKMYDFVPRLLI